LPISGRLAVLERAGRRLRSVRRPGRPARTVLTKLGRLEWPFGRVGRKAEIHLRARTAAAARIASRSVSTTSTPGQAVANSRSRAGMIGRRPTEGAQLQAADAPTRRRRSRHGSARASDDRRACGRAARGLRQLGLPPSAARSNQPLSNDALQRGQLLAHRRRERSKTSPPPRGSGLQRCQEDPQVADL